MLIERTTNDRISLSLESNEALCFSNVVNEVRNGFLVSDFAKTVGISREEADDLSKILQENSTRDSIRLELTKKQLLAIRNSLTESLRELGVDEFHTRVGISLREGEEISREIDRVLEPPSSA